jgi:7 transmembrane receptor (rhodopsin family)
MLGYVDNVTSHTTIVGDVTAAFSRCNGFVQRTHLLVDDDHRVDVVLQVNNSQWMLGEVLCDAWVAFDVLCCTASILNLAAISFDRYVQI